MSKAPKGKTPSHPSKPAVAKPEVPFSEAILEKNDTPQTAQYCVDLLRKMAEARPSQVISRNFFRVYSPIAESVWNAHFGTFHEFKRQAGIVLSRQQHHLEKEIAKHASVDHYRALNTERASWGEKYVRADSGRFKTILCCSDLHDKEIDPFYLRVLIDVARRAQPDVVSFVGDVFDLPEFGKYTVDPREWDVTGRIKFVHKNIFAPIRAVVAPRTQLDLIEGNHEARLMRMLADSTPALRAVLSDLHGMTVSKLLGLDEFEINYVAKADLTAYTKRDFNDELRNNYRIYWNCFLAHHYPFGKDMGLPGVNGHHHRHQVWPMFNPLYGAYEWHQMGAGHRRDASYTAGEKWHMGFTLTNIDTLTRAVTFDYTQVTDFAVAGGQWYYRKADEATTVATLSL